MKMKRVFILWLKFIYFPVAVIAVNDYATKGPNFPSIIQVKNSIDIGFIQLHNGTNVQYVQDTVPLIRITVAKNVAG